jgi:hypothetical protein
MKHKKLYLITGLGTMLLGLIIGATYLNRSQDVFSQSKSVASTEVGAAANVAVGHANWVYDARTVSEQSDEADVIVKVQVLAVQVRKLKQTLPMYAGDGKSVIGEDIDIVPFTDSDMQVLEVYHGSVSDKITVMQTGGNLPATEGDPSINFAIEGDPIYEVGSTHVLFLKDISDDPVHSKGRELYVTVNPAGRYEVKGSEVINSYKVAEQAAEQAASAPVQRSGTQSTSAPFAQPTEAPVAPDTESPNSTPALAEIPNSAAQQGENIELPTTLQELETQIAAALIKQ